MTNTIAALAAIDLAYRLDPVHVPTPTERDTLSAFMGWGGLAKAFDPHPKDGWLDVADRLEQVLPAGAFTSAADQTDTSFFTPRAVTGAVWRILERAGFTGGRVLEPGCGSGAFMSSAPNGLDIDWTGVEIDPTSARIAKLLHPTADIRTGALQDFPLRDGHFDAVVGNVPFSKAHVSDRERRRAALHNYFLWRAVDAVRPGGYVVLVTSRYAMDSQSGIRSVLRDVPGAAVVGAVRLPSGAFGEAGTSAVTDIVVVRKNDAETILPAADWPEDFRTESGWGYYGSRTETVDQRMSVQTGDASVRVSTYWAKHPEHVAGVMRATGFDPAPLAVDGGEAGIARAVMALDVPPMAPREVIPTLDDVELTDADGRKEGSFHVIEGKMHRVENGALVAARATKELAALVDLRDLALALLELESDLDKPDMQIALLRGQTRDAYEAYADRFGHLNRGTLTEGTVDPETGLPKMGWRRPAMGGFRKDPDSAIVFALEVFDQDTGEAKPAAILTRRVNRKPEPVTSAETPAEALAISLGETGNVHLDRVAGLLGLAGTDVAYAALGDLVYTVDGVVRPAAEALSGNVRAKLDRARKQAGRAPDAARYADALEKVVPADLGPGEIEIGLGSPFVATRDICAFLKGELGVNWPTVEHTPETATWEVSGSSYDRAKIMQWGTNDVEPSKLVEHALNNSTPNVTKEVFVDGDWKRRRDNEATAAAQQKLELIQDRFTTWIWEDAERSGRICADYNERMNAYVPRVYDGSAFTFPGLSDGVTPWTHQRAAVERITSSERALIAHPVGAGKTLEMALAARTLRQFGLAQKPLIAVPNHLLEQIAREAQQAFPSGKFLIATKEDLARDARRLFAARCATGDWDAVIMTHSAFGSIPVRPDVEQDWIENEKMDLRVGLSSASSDRSKGAKAIARAVRSLDSRLATLRAGKNDPDAIFFEQLGVDYIMIDELHQYRRLSTGSTSRDSGMPGGSSKRATDLLMKVDQLAARRPGMPVFAGFTGTPWSNTLAETWVWQRFFQPDALDAVGLREFDAWVSMFIRYESSIEVAPDGSGFRMNRRPVGVVNAPELKNTLGQIADILDPAALQADRPTVEQVNVTVEPSPAQRDYVQDLARRADDLRGGNAKHDNDNMLLIVGDGRKVALDPALAEIAEQSSKLTRAADEIAAAYRDGEGRTFGGHATLGAFQLVFMDIGTPRQGGTSQSYGRLRRLIVDRGVPAERVRFVHEATTDKARAALFASCRDGDVSVLIASTSKVGMGTNVQTRLTHLWHIDAPWLPSDVVQRDGRAVRPGNLAGHVQITRFVTAGTFDAYMWQALERKSRAFDALYSTGQTAREIEDVSQATMSYAEVKALASGNPLLLEQATVRAEVKQLQVARAMHLQGVNKAREDAASHVQAAEGASRMLESIQNAISQREDATAEQRDKARGQLETAIAQKWTKTERDYGSYVAQRVRYRGVEMQVDRPQQASPYTVSIAVSYRTFTDVPVAAKTLRAGKAPGRVLDRVDQIVDGLEVRHAELAQRELTHRERAAEFTQAADSATFDQQAELDDARAKLAAIDAEITAAAGTTKAAA